MVWNWKVKESKEKIFMKNLKYSHISIVWTQKSFGKVVLKKLNTKI